MTEKQKIILIYTCVGVFSLLALSGFMTIGHLQKIKMEGALPPAVDIGKEIATEILTIENDMSLTNQAGEEVSVFDLTDKVWVFAQFFAKCPMCAERNYTDLKNIYLKYKDNPDFMIVCMTVDPDTDNIDRLKEYAGAVDADTRNWWFLTGDREEMHRYMTEEMKFLDIRKRQVKEEIATKGLYAHDLGLAVIDKGLIMRTKVDLAFARTQNDDLVKVYETKLHNALESSLNRHE